MRLYLYALGASWVLSFALTPLVRALALRRGWMDQPSSAIKTHKTSTPSLGGIAIYCGFVGTLVMLRLLTNFPTGTLRTLRALIVGGTLVFLLGVVDDLKKPYGLHFKPKFTVQMAAAFLLLYFGIRIRFLSPDYLAVGLTVLWVVGITNAFNIIDIMDGLSASQAAIAALGFLMISLPSEELYVNFASAALAGAALGFIPWNISPRRKIFMGDCGSLFLGFVLSALALGTKYSEINPLGVFAPLLILLIPMYDTFFVMILRIRQGESPFLGSKDHFALRLEKLGYSRGRIVCLAAGAGLFLAFCAFLVTVLPLGFALCIYAVILAELLLLSKALAQVVMRP
ncbi:MAG: undecaprenyl/decaprenyl-phosphate alpha-N-acetylglucosaminyl 1-phosphate transferase [Elusimicrobia bacterium]|nr:undecaprenyl/decaprenyl-phosphate alpha-N-acetylglucosaminyl 1-phosphate transferase [Elusimicrobiota bacterium]